MSLKYGIVCAVTAPLMRTLEQHIPGIKIDRRRRSIPVVAYADDITVFVTRPKDFTITLQAVRCYEQATGARRNPKKSKAPAIGPWTEPATALGIEFHDQVTIQSHIWNHYCQICQRQLAGVLRMVRAQTRRAYVRTQFLAQRIQYVQLCLAKIWYMTQVLPPITVHVKQLTTVCSWFIW